MAVLRELRVARFFQVIYLPEELKERKRNDRRVDKKDADVRFKENGLHIVQGDYKVFYIRIPEMEVLLRAQHQKKYSRNSGLHYYHEQHSHWVRFG